jgi:hypothetical protein
VLAKAIFCAMRLAQEMVKREREFREQAEQATSSTPTPNAPSQSRSPGESVQAADALQFTAHLWVFYGPDSDGTLIR